MLCCGSVGKVDRGRGLSVLTQRVSIGPQDFYFKENMDLHSKRAQEQREKQSTQ